VFGAKTVEDLCKLRVGIVGCGEQDRPSQVCWLGWACLDSC
jgi:hypothetical protein